MLHSKIFQATTLSAGLLALAGTAAYAIPTSTISGIAVGSVGGSDVLTASVGEGSNSITATDSSETNCADTEENGCFFQFTSGTGTDSTLNIAHSDTFTVIYEPDGVTISDIYGISCDSRDPTTGLCATSTGNALAFVSRIPGGPGLDISGLDVGPATFIYGTEIAGPAGSGTSFDASYYLNLDSFPQATASFVSANDVPEPASLALFGGGLLVAGGIAARWRKRKQGAA